VARHLLLAFGSFKYQSEFCRYMLGDPLCDALHLARDRPCWYGVRLHMLLLRAYGEVAQWRWTAALVEAWHERTMHAVLRRIGEQKFLPEKCPFTFSADAGGGGGRGCMGGGGEAEAEAEAEEVGKLQAGAGRVRARARTEGGGGAVAAATTATGHRQQLLGGLACVLAVGAFAAVVASRGRS
jgi:hypothetical protein